MSYARMDHAEWVRKDARVANMSALGEKVANIVGIVGRGIYNAPINVSKVNWTDPRRVEVKWRGEMATFDFGMLTMLVLLCHEARVRVSIEGCGPHLLRMAFFQRKAEGGAAERHPSIDEAVADFRKYLGPAHPLTFLTPLSAAAE